MTEEVRVPEPPGVLDTTQAAGLLGVDDELVRLTARGDLRAVPHSWPLRTRRGELEAFLARQRLAPGELGWRRRRRGR
jgi:hypothetical protein